MKPPPADWRDRLVRGFRWHAWCFLAFNLGLTAINVAIGRPWWAVWPLLVTGLVVGLHYILFKAFTIDERWVTQDDAASLNALLHLYRPVLAEPRRGGRPRVHEARGAFLSLA